MNWDRYLTLFVAGCCLVAVGTAAGTMDASVTTDPEQAVDVDTRLLPIGSDQLWELHTKINGADAGQAGGGASDDGGTTESADGRASVDGEVRDGREAPEQRQQRERRQRQSGAASEKRENSGASEQRSQASSAASDDRSGSDAMIPPEESLLESLVDLLRTLLPLLAVLALVAVAAVILRRFGGDRRGDGDRDETAAGAELRGDLAPANDVSRAWYEMTRRLDLDRRHELTPSERAAAAAERGADPEAATSLTRLFEEVRYGGEPVTDDRRERARRWLERLRTRSSERENS